MRGKCGLNARRVVELVRGPIVGVSDERHLGAQLSRPSSAVAFLKRYANAIGHPASTQHKRCHGSLALSGFVGASAEPIINHLTRPTWLARYPLV